MKQRDILFIAISAFALIVFWIGFNIYHNLAVTTISEPIEKNIIPISPNFDTKTIDAIKRKSNIPPLFEIEVSSRSSTEQQSLEIHEEPSPASTGAEGGIIAP